MRCTACLPSTGTRWAANLCAALGWEEVLGCDEACLTKTSISKQPGGNEGAGVCREQSPEQQDCDGAGLEKGCT
jgi:hypothetical protein